MATLKVYSREYGVKKIEEKVSLTKLEMIIYTIFPLAIVFAMYTMLGYNSEIYSLKNKVTVNSFEIKKMQNDNEEQRVIMNDLSSYERIKAIAGTLGMESHKDNVKVVR